MNVGIDYGMGRTNVDMATGIRYGVISQHSICQAWADSSEADYGDPTCPKCGAECCAPKTELTDDVDDLEFEQYGRGCADYECEHCKITFDSQDAFGDEPRGWNYNGDGYEMVDCLDSAVMILKSPYYTFAPFCSPCVPGAGDINSTRGGMDEGVKTYCVGHDWFEDGEAPYTVYSVETGKPVAPTGVVVTP